VQKYNRPELKALTSLRGIAALFVLWHHFVFVLMGEVGQIIPSWVLFKSFLWVDLFFILSGFVLAYVYQQEFVNKPVTSDYKHFIRARFARIYPLHFFILLLFVLSEIVQWCLIKIHQPGSEFLPIPFAGEHNLPALITNILLLQTFHWGAYWNQPAWSISAEFLTYLIVPWLIYYCLRFSWRLLFVIAVLIIASLAIVEQHFGSLGYDYAGWPMLIRCAGEAILGIMVCRAFAENKWQFIANKKWVFPVLGLNFILLAFPISGAIQIPAFVWLVFCAARIPVGENHLLHFTPLVYLGKISFSVYLSHWLLLDLLRMWALYLTGKPLADLLNLWQEILVIALSTVFVLILSSWLYHKIETPWRKRIMGNQ
jgi:peptidoglycan/LPS O-acetylase OafA/YrhL